MPVLLYNPFLSNSINFLFRIWVGLNLVVEVFPLRIQEGPVEAWRGWWCPITYSQGHLMVIWADVYVLLSEVFLMCAREAQKMFFSWQSVATFPKTSTLLALNNSHEAFCLFFWHHHAFVFIHIFCQIAFRKYECLYLVTPSSFTQTESYCAVQLSNKI